MTSEKTYESDVLVTSEGELKITFLGHGSLLFQFKGLQIYTDPFSRVADFSDMPKANIILITHEHMDHLDLPAINSIRTPETAIVLTETCAKQLSGGKVLRNGEQVVLNGVSIQAVPAYNMVNKRPDGSPFHPKGVGNGYILTFGDQQVYVAGDTEDIPEMKTLKGITCAFLPMNLPYTMTPEMVANAARAFKPKILYPYHFGDTKTDQILDLLKSETEVEVRIRALS
jgi:L-ascorbate metabolism protein UlaG (beta-lactamase superfamily)